MIAQGPPASDPQVQGHSQRASRPVLPAALPCLLPSGFLDDFLSCFVYRLVVSRDLEISDLREIAPAVVEVDELPEPALPVLVGLPGRYPVLQNGFGCGQFADGELRTRHGGPKK